MLRCLKQGLQELWVLQSQHPCHAETLALSRGGPLGGRGKPSATPIEQGSSQEVSVRSLRLNRLLKAVAAVLFSAGSLARLSRDPSSGVLRFSRPACAGSMRLTSYITGAVVLYSRRLKAAPCPAQDKSGRRTQTGNLWGTGHQCGTPRSGSGQPSSEAGHDFASVS